jgi:hypothetical protein
MDFAIDSPGTFSFTYANTGPYNLHGGHVKFSNSVRPDLFPGVFVSFDSNTSGSFTLDVQPGYDEFVVSESFLLDVPIGSTGAFTFDFTWSFASHADSRSDLDLSGGVERAILLPNDRNGSSPLPFTSQYDLSTILANRSLVTDGGTQSIGFYVSTDTDIDPNEDVLLGTVLAPTPAPSPDRDSVTVIRFTAASLFDTLARLSIPDDAWRERVYFGAIADIFNTIEESDESNNASDYVSPVPILRTTVESLGFGGSGFTAVTSDPLPNRPGELYDGTLLHHWLDSDGNGTAEVNVPVSFASGTKPVVRASLKMGIPYYTTHNVLVRVRTGTNQNWAPSSGTQTSPTEILVENLELAEALPGAVFVDDFFNLQWEISFDNGGSWVNAGTTSHQVYVTLDRPQISPLYHTIVDVGTRRAIGATTTDEVIDRVWADFADLRVFQVPRAKDGSGISTPSRLLTYYGDPDTLNTYPWELLRDGDGQCAAWTDLFLEVLAANGIVDGEILKITARGPHEGLLIRNWDFPAFPGGGLSGDPRYPYLYDATFLVGILPPTVRPWSELVDLDGMSAQGTSNPKSHFLSHHRVAFINGTYYDPSYGKMYTGLDDMEEQVIAGFYVERSVPRRFDERANGIDVNGDGDIDDRFFVSGKIARSNDPHVVGELMVAERVFYPPTDVGQAMTDPLDAPMSVALVIRSAAGQQALRVAPHVSETLGEGIRDSAPLARDNKRVGEEPTSTAACRSMSTEHKGGVKSTAGLVVLLPCEESAATITRSTRRRQENAADKLTSGTETESIRMWTRKRHVGEPVAKRLRR